MKPDNDCGMYEYACHEGNTAIRNYIEMSRFERAQRMERPRPIPRRPFSAQNRLNLRRPDTSSFSRALLVATALLMRAATAHAECMVSGNLCTAFEAAEMVFLADVRELTSAGIVFDVREAFKNARPGLVTLSFVQSIVEHQFRQGERVLVFARRNQKELLSSLCGRTRVVAENDPDVLTLRHLAHRDPGGMVDGGMSRFDFRWTRYPGLRVTLRPLSGSGRAQSTVTDRGGYYRFDWVPPGTYAVILDGPPGVRSQQRMIYVGVQQKCLSVRAFIIPSAEHGIIADRDD